MFARSQIVPNDIHWDSLAPDRVTRTQQGFQISAYDLRGHPSIMLFCHVTRAFTLRLRKTDNIVFYTPGLLTLARALAHN